MKCWNPSYNWTFKQFISVVQKALRIEGKESVSLDVEHCDHQNMSDMIRWAESLGYAAVEVNSDLIRVSKRNS